MNKIFLRRTFFSGRKILKAERMLRWTSFLAPPVSANYLTYSAVDIEDTLSLNCVLSSNFTPFFTPGSYSAVIRAKCAARMFPFTNPEPGDIVLIHTSTQTFGGMYTSRGARTFLWRAAWRARVSTVMRCIKFQYSSPAWRLIIIHIYITSTLWRSHTSIRKLDIQMWPYFVTDALCKLIAN